MTKQLPKGWVRTTLSEICLPVETIRPEDSPNRTFTYFDIGGIDNETNRVAETKIIAGRDAPSRARKAIRKGDILFSTVRVYLRKIARVDHDYTNPVASTGFTVIRPAEGVSSHFLFFQMLSDDFLQTLDKLQTGTSYPAVRDSDVLAQQILLPPISEQERIVTKVNAALLRLERATKAARRAQERVQRYRAAVLQSAITGELTRAWRESQRKKKVESETGAVLLQRLLSIRRAYWEESESKRFQSMSKKPQDNSWKSRYPEPTPPEATNLIDLPQRWTWTNLSQLKIHSLYGPRFSGSDYTENGIAVLRTTDIDASGHVSLKTCPKLPLSDEEYEKYKVEAGDLLITRTGSIGTLAVFNDEVRAIPGAYLLHYRLADTAVVPFVYIFFRAPIGQEQLWEASAGSGRQNLSAPELERISIPFPPIDEQAEIVQEVERRLSAADGLALALEKQLSRALTARQSLLTEACTGRLLPQDPNDEPASALLKQIRIVREAQAKAPRAKRMPKPRSQKTRRPLLDVLRESSSPITPEQLFSQAGFKPAQVDLFYRELALLRDQLRVEKPKGSEAKSWPSRAQVTLQLKET